MKTWILVTLSVLSFQAAAQSTLPLPSDYDNPSTTQGGQQPPAIKPLDPADSVADEPVVVRPREKTPLPDQTNQTPRPKVDIPNVPDQQDPWGNSRQPTGPTSSENQVYLQWITVIEQCLPRNGGANYDLLACPSYAVAGIRYALEDRSLRGGLYEFDQVLTPISRDVTINRIYGGFKNAVTYETGVQSAACVARQGSLTQCVIGRRNAVLSWIRSF